MIRKIIKKFLNTFGWISTLTILLILILLVGINMPDVQNYLADKAFSKFEQKLGNHLSYSKVKISLLSRASFDNLYISDQNGDTIIYAKKFEIRLPGFLRRTLLNKKQAMRIGSLVFEDSYFRLHTDTSQVLNIRFIIDSLKGKPDSSKSPQPFFLDRIKIENSRFLLANANVPAKDTGVDYGHMQFKDLEIELKDLQVFYDTVSFMIQKLAFLEKSGFEMSRFRSNFKLCRTQLYFDNTYIITPRSAVEFEKFHFDFDKIGDFGIDFFNLVEMDIKASKSTVNMADVGYFADFFSNNNQLFTLSGNFTGPLANMNVRNFFLAFGENSYLKGKFDVSGLPDPQSTFLIFDVQQLATTISDINNLKLPGNKRVQLPESLKKVKTYQYKGNFTGFFNDFVSYGTLTTDLGVLKTDILLRPEGKNQIAFSGEFGCTEFNVGEFTTTPEKIGKISMKLSVNGIGEFDKGFKVDTKGDVSLFEINGYPYTAISVNGRLEDKRFNGELNIDDPNARMSFKGLIDLSSEIWNYNFTANVLYADLYTLNLEKKDENFEASFLLKANISGNTLDEINGNITLLNSLFSKTNAQIQVYDLNLHIRNDHTLNELRLNSDFLESTIVGQYKLSQLINEYINLTNTIVPAIGLKPQINAASGNSNFSFRMLFKNSQPFFDFFSPNYKVSPNTLVEGKLNRNGNLTSKVHIESDEVRFKDTFLQNLIVNAESEGTHLNVDLGCKKLNLSNRFELQNYTLISDIDSNEAGFKMRWFNWDSSVYKGSLLGKLNLLNMPGEKLITWFKMDRSDLVINDSLWSLSPFEFLLDSSKVKVDGFRLTHKNEYLEANGILSDVNLTDSITCKFQSFNFANLNIFTRSEALKFNGMLSGNVLVTGLKKPLFFSSLFIENLGLNGQLIGNTYIQSSWNNKKQSLAIDANVFRGKLNTLNIKGDIYPSKGSELDLVLNFDKFYLDFINPYLDMVFDDVRGMASGVVTLTGTPSQPNLNGELQLQKAAFTVDYLKTRYNFTSRLGISNNNLLFDNVKLNDKFGNVAILNGQIRTEYFKQYDLKLNLEATKFLFLNTTQVDNDFFYGTAFATGLVRIAGKPESLKFNVTASTEPGSVFNLPLMGSEELTEYTFIKYLSSTSADTDKEKEKTDYKVNLTGMQMDFNVKLTPDAKIRLIFDPTIGDVMEGQGSGDLRMLINTLGDFKMYGEYVIDNGEYLFTLQDILVNKRFKVVQGGWLRWSGDPVNADANIETYYRTKASLSDLDRTYLSTSSKTVDCKLKLTGKIMQPSVEYDIDLPFSEQSDKDILDSRISTEEEKGKQFLALMLLNRFLPATGGNQQSSSIGGDEIAGVNASELLSNQVSNWLSQISSEFDVGFNYRPGTELSDREVEVALSTQLLNDRLSINGSVDMKTNAEANNASNIVGDIDVDYKITKNGRFRARVFYRGNEDDFTGLGSVYTQGVGVFYTEEFDTFDEVAQRYNEALFGKRKKKKEKQENSTNDNAIKNEEDEPSHESNSHTAE